MPREASIYVQRDGKIIRLVGRQEVLTDEGPESKIVFSLDFTSTQATDIAQAFIAASVEADLDEIEGI